MLPDVVIMTETINYQTTHSKKRLSLIKYKIHININLVKKHLKPSHRTNGLCFAVNKQFNREQNNVKSIFRQYTC